MVHVDVLVDNAEREGLCSEWGLSLLVHRGSSRVLLDFGQSDAFINNAKTMGIDLDTVDAAVLSHAHYDHANGMEGFFGRNGHAPLYLSEACDETCWSTKGGTNDAHYIGIRKGLLERFAQRLVRVPTDRVTTIDPGIHIVPHNTPRLANKGERDGMLLCDGNKWRPDSFAHEISLVVELGDDTDAPLAVFNSCSHAGPAVILNEVASAFAGRTINAYVGGLHLFRSRDSNVLQIAHDLQAAGVTHIYTGHCTGERAIELLRATLPGRVTPLRPGLSFDLG